MNTLQHPRTTSVKGPSTSGRLAVLSLAVTLCAGLSGCSFLKPAQSTARHYVLAPVAPTGPSPAGAGGLAVGLGQVKLPAYLFNTSLAIRKGTNEIKYLPSAIWAERLDAGFQRILAANLATLLPTDSLFVSAWQKDDVAVEVYVGVEEFDVDTEGQGVLVARWRLLPPGGDKILKSGRSRLVRQGPPPGAGAAGTVATLSELVAEFSRQLSKALQDSNIGAQTK